MEVYRRSKLFKIHVWMIPLGRGALILAGLSLLFLGLYKDRLVNGLYQNVEALMFSLFGLWFVFILTGVAIAAFIKCDNCGKHPTVKVKEINFPPEKPKNELEAIINDFYPIEIRTKRFRCIHCGTEYSLKDWREP